MQLEVLKTVSSKLLEQKRTRFHFGSQSEGTTTPSMGSDSDWLLCEDRRKVIRSLSDWERGAFNLLLLKDATTPPRHYRLQVYSEFHPRPVMNKIARNMCTDSKGRIFVKTSIADVEDWTIKHGPSRSYLETIDIVHAYRCNQLPIDCLAWRKRPRIGHWPTSEMTSAACKHGVFLLAVGHPESVHSKVEWRLSTSMLERVFMFSLNMVQLKTYILLKLIKNAFLKPIVGDNFTSFNCKTALLFTVENTPPNFWTDSNLCVCVIQCLRTILRWLKDNFFPHYFIPSMNLLSGKLAHHERKKIIPVIEGIIENNLQCVFQIRYDKIGERLKSLVTLGRYENQTFASRFSIHSSIVDGLSEDFAYRISENVLDLINSIITAERESALDVMLMYLTQLHNMVDDEDELVRKNVMLYIPHVCSYIASLQAASCIDEGRELSNKTLDLFRIAFQTDVASSRLKFASICYKLRKFELAAEILDYVEDELSHGYIATICGCGRYYGDPEDKSRGFWVSRGEYVRTSVAFCVRFVRGESSCITDHLVAEMYRSRGDDVIHRTPEDPYWMDMTCVNSFAFLYYLQFLTHSALGNRAKKHSSLDKLSLEILLRPREGHIETTLNMLGHCFELEHKDDLAMSLYMKSQNALPRNNAANFHISDLELYS